MEQQNLLMLPGISLAGEEEGTEEPGIPLLFKSVDSSDDRVSNLNACYIISPFIDSLSLARLTRSNRKSGRESTKLRSKKLFALSEISHCPTLSLRQYSHSFRSTAWCDRL
jgi:hypothetical protein